MPFRTIPQLLVALVAVAALAFAAGAYGASPVAVGAAAAFAAVVIAGTGLALLKGGGGVVHVSQACAELMALTWCWGGVSLLLAYGPAGLKWQHGWQYACAMLLIAVALAWHARRIVPGSNAATLFALEWGRKAAFAQGLACGIGLAWLIGSGKLATVKGDWAANDVFLSGGFTLLLLSAMAIVGGGVGCPATSKAQR